MWWLIGGVAGFAVLLAWCRWVAWRDRLAAEAALIAAGVARAEWWANASEIERLDQVLTGSEPWRARRVR